MRIQQQFSTILFTSSAITINCVFSILGIQNSAVAFFENQVSSNKATSISIKEPVRKQPSQVAINDIYWGPNRDFKVRMPGRVQENEGRKLSSYSQRTQTLYIISHQNLPSQTDYLSAKGIRELLQITMRKQMNRGGKVIRSTNYTIQGYPGLELLVQHKNGFIGQYRTFIVKKRMYIMGAATKGEFGAESENFFNSFRVYPQRLP